MKEFLLNDYEIDVLRSLSGSQVLQVVWDLPGVFFVDSQRTISFEVKIARPESPEPAKYDEVFYLQSKETNFTASDFEAGEADHYWTIFGRGEFIKDIEIVRIAIVFPDEEIKNPSQIETGKEIGLNLVDCGLLVHLESGILPAVIRNNWFGLDCWEKRLYQRTEIHNVLGDVYEVLPISPRGAA